MALTDFWEIKDNQIYNGQPVLNVYHAKRILAGATAGTVGQAFLDAILTGGLLAMQPNGIGRTTLEVANLGDATDFASIGDSSYVGVLTSADLPSFNVATIQFNRTRNDMKNGQKRFFAGTEAEQTDGVWVAGMLTLMNTLGTAIVTPWETIASPGVDVCEFVILRRFCVVAGQDPCLAYRLPKDSAEIDAWHYAPFSILSRDKVRSQVSRKILI